MNYHRLLSRQIAKNLKNDLSIIESDMMKNFLNVISESYDWADKNTKRLNLSLELVSNELGERYEEAQVQIAKMQEAKIEQNRLFSIIQSTLNASLDGILLVSADNKPMFMNKQVCDLFNTTESFLMLKGYDGLKMLATKHSRNAAVFIEQLTVIEYDKNITTACTLEFTHGKVVEISSKCRIQNAKNIGRIWSFHDITETRYNKDTTGYKAYHDSLTNLPNRHLFSERVNIALDTQKQNKKEFCLMYIDLDGFKFINDTLGHEVGDEVLQEIAVRFKSVIPEDKGIVARHGGDEFLVIFEHYTDSDDVAKLAQAILDETEKQLTLNDFAYYLSSSIGIVIAPQDGDSASKLIRNADVAMYCAKQNTKNCYMYFEPTMADKSKYELHLKSELHYAIKNKEFELFFQPKIAMGTRELIGAEALIRWFRDGKQVSPPNEFIDTAERTGLIVPISEWVFDNAIKQTAMWKEYLPKKFSMGINVSPKHFKYPNMVDDLKKMVHHYQLRPESIELEITEGVVIDYLNDSIKKLAELREYGFRLAIDDFGTGYSSFNYLKDLPVDILKIDRSFILNIESSQRDLSLVASIIDIAHTLELEVVVEGIENENSHQLIRNVGCDIAQGYYYGRPMPANEFTELLHKYDKG